MGDALSADYHLADVLPHGIWCGGTFQNEEERVPRLYHSSGHRSCRLSGSNCLGGGRTGSQAIGRLYLQLQGSEEEQDTFYQQGRNGLDSGATQ